MRPETSVIVPVRNGARFIAEAIASVLEQLGDGDEVLVIDDGFAEDMPMGEDVDFYLRLLEAGMRFRLCEVSSLVRRHHDANATNDHAQADPWRLEFLRRKLARAKAPSAIKRPPH